MPAPRLHPFWRLLICAGNIVLAQVLVFAVMTAALTWGASYANRPAGPEIEAFWSDPANLLWATLLFYPLALIVLLTCRHALDRRSVSSLGLRPSLPISSPPALRAFGGGAACGALAISFLFGILWSVGAVRIVGFSPEAFGGGFFVSFAMLTLYAALFFAVGFMEELLFRGYGLHNLRAWLGLPAAIAVQAIVFAVAHAGNGATQVTSQTLADARWAMLNIALIGWFFALAYIKTGTLWFPIGFHVAWNWFMGCIWSLPVSGIPVFRLLDVTSSENTALSGGKFGAESSLLLAPLILAMLYLLRHSPDHPQARADLQSLLPPYIDETAATEPPVSLTAESDWAAPDPDRERRFKTSMRAEASPEIAGAELDKLARELEASSRRAAASALPAPMLPTMPATTAPVAPAAPQPPPPPETVASPPDLPEIALAPETTVAELLPSEARIKANPPSAEAENVAPVPPPANEPAPPAPKRPRW